MDKSACLFYLCQQQCLYLSHDDCLLASLRDVFFFCQFLAEGGSSV